MKDITGNEIRPGAIVVVAIDEGGSAAMRWAVVDLMRATSRGVEYADIYAIRRNALNGRVVPRNMAIDGSLMLVVDRSRVPDDVLSALDELRPPRHHEQLNQPSGETDTIDLRVKAIEGRLSEIDGRLSEIESLRPPNCGCPVEFELEPGEWDYDGPDNGGAGWGTL